MFHAYKILQILFTNLAAFLYREGAHCMMEEALIKFLNRLTSLKISVFTNSFTALCLTNVNNNTIEVKVTTFKFLCLVF